jgi:hypothetical protein
MTKWFLWKSIEEEIRKHCKAMCIIQCEKRNIKKVLQHIQVHVFIKVSLAKLLHEFKLVDNWRNVINAKNSSVLFCGVINVL